MFVQHRYSRSTDDSMACPAVGRVSKTAFLAVTWTVTAISLLFLLFRLAIRVRSFKKLFVDDYLVILAWLMLLASTIVYQLKIHLLYREFGILLGEKHASPQSAAYSTFFPQVFAWNFLFNSCLWAVKFSFLIFFRRLGSKITEHAIWWRVVFCLTLAGWIACIADIDFKFALNNITHIMMQCILDKHVKLHMQTFYVNMAIDVVTDLLILSIPLLILRNVRIPWRRKLILFGIFSVTVFVMVVAIIRVATVRVAEYELRSIGFDWQYLWSSVEMGVAIIVSCITSFRQLFVFNTNADARGGKGRSQTRFYRGSLPYLDSSRNSSGTGIDRSSQNKWSDSPPGPEASGSFESDSQTGIALLNPVYVSTTTNIISPPAGLQDRKRSESQQRGDEFV